jgi:DNA-binding SARP family transcriptional activator
MNENNKEKILRDLGNIARLIAIDESRESIYGKVMDLYARVESINESMED